MSIASSSLTASIYTCTCSRAGSHSYHGSWVSSTAAVRRSRPSASAEDQLSDGGEVANASDDVDERGSTVASAVGDEDCRGSSVAGSTRQRLFRRPSLSTVSLASEPIVPSMHAPPVASDPQGRPPRPPTGQTHRRPRGDAPLTPFHSPGISPSMLGMPHPLGNVAGRNPYRLGYHAPETQPRTKRDVLRRTRILHMEGPTPFRRHHGPPASRGEQSCASGGSRATGASQNSSVQRRLVDLSVRLEQEKAKREAVQRELQVVASIQRELESRIGNGTPSRA
jgi:hypothetical protein